MPAAAGRGQRGDRVAARDPLPGPPRAEREHGHVERSERAVPHRISRSRASQANRGSPSSGIGAQSGADDSHWRQRGWMPGSPCSAPKRTPTIPSDAFGSPAKTCPPQIPQNDFESPSTACQVRSELGSGEQLEGGDVDHPVHGPGRSRAALAAGAVAVAGGLELRRDLEADRPARAGARQWRLGRWHARQTSGIVILVTWIGTAHAAGRTGR